jgi:hypothetical protein
VPVASSSTTTVDLLARRQVAQREHHATGYRPDTTLRLLT